VSEKYLVLSILAIFEIRTNRKVQPLAFDFWERKAAYAAFLIFNGESF
jgi:hypothetical protein